MNLDEHHEQLMLAVSEGNLARVKSIVASLFHVGPSPPPRLSLLERRAASGKRAVDLARELRDGGKTRDAILEFLEDQHVLMMSFDERHDQLMQAVRNGDLRRVRSIVTSLVGVGMFPQRLALLERKASDGKRAADLARELLDGGDTRDAILDLLESERMRMELFE